MNPEQSHASEQPNQPPEEQEAAMQAPEGQEANPPAPENQPNPEAQAAPFNPDIPVPEAHAPREVDGSFKADFAGLVDRIKSVHETQVTQHKYRDPKAEAELDRILKGETAPLMGDTAPIPKIDTVKELNLVLSELRSMGNPDAVRQMLETARREAKKDERAVPRDAFVAAQMDDIRAEAQKSVGANFGKVPGMRPTRAAARGIVNRAVHKHKIKGQLRGLGEVPVGDFEAPTHAEGEPILSELIGEVSNLMKPENLSQKLGPDQTEANQALDSWKIGEPSVESETAVIAALARQKELIDKAIEEESETAEAVGNFVTTRYRLEARRIAAGQQDEYDSEYNNDGGIVINSGKVVIYPDGSSMRVEPAGLVFEHGKWVHGTDQWVRRQPNGETVEPTERPALVERQADPDVSAADIRGEYRKLYKTWETSRDDEATEALWQTTRQLAEKLEENTDGATKSQRSRLMKEANRLRYLQATLEVGRQIEIDPESAKTAAKLGGLATGGKFGDSEAKPSLSREASFNTDGAVKWLNAKVNDQFGDWVIYPDGSTIQRLAENKYERYSPDGRVLPVSKHDNRNRR